jgi:hypothetical protein
MEKHAALRRSNFTRPAMRIRNRILAFAAALIVQLQSHSTSASVIKSERTADIIAAQLHIRGVACTAPRSPVRYAASVPDESVWILRCNEATYRVTLNPGGRRVEIRPISIGRTLGSQSEQSRRTNQPSLRLSFRQTGPRLATRLHGGRKGQSSGRSPTR